MIEFFGQHPARDTAAGFNLHPPLANPVLDNVYSASARAKAGGEAALALLAYSFSPHRKPYSLCPEDHEAAKFQVLDAVTQGGCLRPSVKDRHRGRCT